MSECCTNMEEAMAGGIVTLSEYTRDGGGQYSMISSCPNNDADGMYVPPTFKVIAYCPWCAEKIQ